MIIMMLTEEMEKKEHEDEIAILRRIEALRYLINEAREQGLDNLADQYAEELHRVIERTRHGRFGGYCGSGDVEEEQVVGV